MSRKYASGVLHSGRTLEHRLRKVARNSRHGDHGGKDKGHGGKSLLEMEVPFIIAGKNVRQGGEFKEVNMRFDTAATIAYIFGLEQPQAWIGRPAVHVFK